MKKIFFALLGCFIAICAHAAQIVNVDYVHKLIAQKWDISVPIKADNPMHVANMKYLLTAIDVANEILNGEKTTDYGNGEFATLQVADTTATNQAVETLIKKEQKYEFTLTTTNDTDSFEFSISAAGEFVVDWGDGKTETITKPDTTDTRYSHNYTTAGAYTIGLSGQATAYNAITDTVAISFYSSASKIASIDGSLGAIFGTLADGSQPCFYQTFSDATNMRSIPANLFAGISGAPVPYMFSYTFSGCSKLTSIPENLFADITSGAHFLFQGTFSGCSGLTSIPNNLFSSLSGNLLSETFSYTFSGCSKLTSIPENLFGNISGNLSYGVFQGMFASCTSLTGPSARINGKYLYEIWPDATSDEVDNMYYKATGLSDYSNIPTVWK